MELFDQLRLYFVEEFEINAAVHVLISNKISKIEDVMLNERLTMVDILLPILIQMKKSLLLIIIEIKYVQLKQHLE